MAAVKGFLRTLTANVTSSASMTRQVGKPLSAGVITAASIAADAITDAKVAAENIEIVALLNSRVQFAAFIEGSDKGNTRAKPEIWKEAAKYKDAADKMQAEIGKLNVAAKSGNIDALKAAFGPAAASCKACHDVFRKD